MFLWVCWVTTYNVLCQSSVWLSVQKGCVLLVVWKCFHMLMHIFNEQFKYDRSFQFNKEPFRIKNCKILGREKNAIKLIWYQLRIKFYKVFFVEEPSRVSEIHHVVSLQVFILRSSFNYNKTFLRKTSNAICSSFSFIRLQTLISHLSSAATWKLLRRKTLRW